MKSPRNKLIEVALPLDAINAAAARDKSIRHGHPSTLHLWWARRPLAAARAVIFAQMVDDPSARPDLFPTKAEQEKERERLFHLIAELVKWENTTNEQVLEQARTEIRKSWRHTCADHADHPRAAELFDPDKLPAFHDPFAGGGALPLEAQRLGLEAHASDLNPVAVLINKAMIEIPPKFAGQPPVNPASREEKSLIEREWTGAQGLAEDVRYYGQWMRDEAKRRIGHLYPQVEITEEMVRERPDLERYKGRKLTVIAWLWARTVKSPNPAFADVDVPLASTFMLSTKKGKEAYVEPVIEGREYRFVVKVGKPKDAAAAKRGTKLARGANFRCVMSGAVINDPYIKAESMAGRMGARLMAIVVEGDRGRVYLAPTPEHEDIAGQAEPMWKPDQPMNRDTSNLVSGRGYGFFTWADLFTPRQLVALTTFSDLVAEAMERVKNDYLGARASRTQANPSIIDPPKKPRTQASQRLAHPDAPSDGYPSTDSARIWHSRGYHPHLDVPGLIQSVTFRLADSVPYDLLQQWREDLRIDGKNPPDSANIAALMNRIAKYEDAGHGACHLRRAEIGQLVQNALLHFDGERYRLLEWCIMPNHVHVLIKQIPGYPLGDVVQTWKSFTAKQANRILGRSGSFWMPDYYDRFVRDDRHLAAVQRYIRDNPVQAGLCEAASEWPWSSASIDTPLATQTSTGARASRPPAGQRPAHRPAHLRDDVHLRNGGAGATAYAEAVGVYLGFLVDQLTNHLSSICSWNVNNTQLRSTFARQALPMTWDYAESNPLCNSTGSFNNLWERQVKVFTTLESDIRGTAFQADAKHSDVSVGRVVSTDPPYYDNIGYADLSDFFYVWLRRSMRSTFPDLFSTLAVPKAEELVATPYRHGSKKKAETFFLAGMTDAMQHLADQAHPAFPVTIYYAFKQSETKGDAGTSSTGWETFLDAVIQSGFSLTGTWPMGTELRNRMVGQGTNALASSIVLVCRQRPANAPMATRREFITALRSELPTALTHLQSGNIAPVDLAQAAIGPGMAAFTRYAKVLDAEGNPVSVREALVLINQMLDEVLAEQEGDFDPDSRWALAWFEQHGFDEGEYGVAETLSKAKNTSIAGIVEGGILASSAGKVRLLRPDELAGDWDPTTDTRLTVWEAVHHLIRALETGGELEAAHVVSRLGSKADIARELAYRLYTICERKRRNAEALSYNSLVQSWPEIADLARQERQEAPPEQSGLFGASHTQGAT